MRNYNYMTVYYEVLKHNMILKKYIPVQETLFELFDYLEKMGIFYYETDIIYFVKELLRVISRAMKEKRIDEIKDMIDYMIVINEHSFKIPSIIEALVFKEDVDSSQFASVHLWYNMKIMDVCDSSRDNKDKVMEFDSDNRFIQIIKIFLKYMKPEYVYTRLKSPEDQIMQDYNRIGRGIIPDIYNSDLDLCLLDKFFYDIVNNYQNTMDYLELNGLLFRHHYKYDILNVLEVLKQYDTEKKIIIR